jgi:hypothetical protein
MSVANGKRRTFDWLALFTRLIVIVALVTLFLIREFPVLGRTGIALVVGIGYVVLPAIAYIHTRYFNMVLNFGIVETVKRRIDAGRHRAR